MVLTERSGNHVHSVITSVLHTAHSEHQAIYVAYVLPVHAHFQGCPKSRSVLYCAHVYTKTCRCRRYLHCE